MLAIMVPYTREDEKEKVSAGESEYADIEAAGADGRGHGVGRAGR